MDRHIAYLLHLLEGIFCLSMLPISAGFALQMVHLPDVNHTSLKPGSQINSKEDITSLVSTGKLLGERGGEEVKILFGLSSTC